jgi:threonine/homoserine/homoserine lactone efflux protein
LEVDVVLGLTQLALYITAAFVLAITPGSGIFYCTPQAARRDASAELSGGLAETPVGARRAFREGVLVEALNPKTAAFFLAFIPQFVSPATGSVALQFMLLVDKT